jgi:predicted peptidase
MKYLCKTLTVLMVIGLSLSACKKETLKDEPGDNNTEKPTAPAPAPPTNKYDNVVETTKPVNKGISVDVNDNIGGYLYALPSLYDSTTKKYPLLLFIHGIGELGNGTTQLNNAAAVGVPSVIKWGQFPANFNVGGKNYSFIVITPQFKKWPSPKDVNDMIDYAIKKYRIDTTRMYVSGLSMGGGATWDYAAEYGKRIAAIVPICGASGPNDTKAKKIAQAGLAVWAFHNKDDGTVPYTNSEGYVTKINAQNPPIKAKLTLWPTGGHDAWTKSTSPSYKEDGKNIYEWMLQYSRSAK